MDKLAKIGIHSKGSSEVIAINYAYEKILVLRKQLILLLKSHVDIL